LQFCSSLPQTINPLYELRQVRYNLVYITAGQKDRRQAVRNWKKSGLVPTQLPGAQIKKSKLTCYDHRMMSAVLCGIYQGSTGQDGNCVGLCCLTVFYISATRLLASSPFTAY